MAGFDCGKFLLEVQKGFRDLKLVIGWIAHHIDVEQVPCFKAGQHVGKATCGLLITWMLKRRYLVETAPPADLEVEQIFEVGEWEKLREDVSNWKSVGPGSVGVVQEVELVEDEELHIGDWVKVKASVSTPTHQWGEVNHSSVGVVHRMENGDLRVAFSFMELARKVFGGHLYLIDDIAS
ncbi:hypothetical protein Peur_056575 [Populus x canadensis]